MTAARMDRAIQVFPVWGALPAASCQSPTSGWSASTSAELAETKHISPGLAGVSRSGTVVWAAITTMSSSSSRSRTVPCSSVAIDTR